VAQRLRLVDSPADRRHDLVDDAEQMRLVLEAHEGGLEHARALDIDLLVAVDQDVVDGRILEQRLDGAEPHHLVEDLGDEILELLGVERQTFGDGVLRDERVDLPADLVLRHLLERGEIDLLDQSAMQADLGVEQFLADRAAAPIELRRRLWLGRWRLGRKRGGCRGRDGVRRRHRLGRHDATGGETSEHAYPPVWSVGEDPFTGPTARRARAATGPRTPVGLPWLRPAGTGAS